MSLEKGENSGSNNTEKGIVNKLLTNTPDHTYVGKARLVSQLLTNYTLIPNVIDSPGLVNWLLTNLRGKKGEILLYTNENPVFLQPNIWKTLGLSKEYTTRIIKQLIRLNLVKKTKYSIIPPIRNLGGRRPTIFTLFNIELNESSDPRIQEARNKYYETFTRYDLGHLKDPKNIVSVDLLSQQVVDYYSQQGKVGVDLSPSKHQILANMKTMKEADGIDSITLLNIAQRIYNDLSFMEPTRRAPI